MYSKYFSPKNNSEIKISKILLMPVKNKITYDFSPFEFVMLTNCKISDIKCKFTTYYLKYFHFLFM